jgi:hypothetical protein
VVQKLLTAGSVEAADFERTFQFTITDKLLYVDAKLNKSDSVCRFVFDTYAVNLVRQDLIERLNLEMTELAGPFAEQLEGTMLAPRMVRFDSIQLGDLLFKGYGGFAIKEDPSHDILAYLEDGILGANLMNKLIWQINFRDSTIMVTDKLSRCGFIDGAVRLPFRPHSLQKSPDIEVVVNGRDTLNLQFDTGSNAVMRFNTVNIAPYLNSGQYVRQTSVPALNMGEESAEPRESFLVRLDEVEIGSTVLNNIPVQIYETSEKALDGRGQLGNAFMRHFIVTIDWFENMIYLFPRSDNPLKTQKRSFGLAVGLRDGAVRILSILEGSEAEKMGLKTGDEVSAIDGKDMTDLSAEDIRLYIQGFKKFLNAEDERVNLTVKSGEKTQNITLKSFNLFKI